jgi:hypothetical protein
LPTQELCDFKKILGFFLPIGGRVATVSPYQSRWMPLGVAKKFEKNFKIALDESSEVGKVAFSE